VKKVAKVRREAAVPWGREDREGQKVEKDQRVVMVLQEFKEHLVHLV